MPFIAQDRVHLSRGASAQVVDYRVVKMPVTKGGRLELTITELGDE